jgi:glycosyltransferase 2 family protein
MRKYRNQIIAGLVIAFAIYIGLLLFVNTGELLEHLQNYPWHLLVPIVVLKLLSWGFHFLKWQYFLQIIGARDKISLVDSAALFFAGFTLVISPGKLAEVLKAVVLKAKTSVPIARSVPVIIAERVIDGTSVLAIVFAALLLAGNNIDIGPYRWIILLATALLLLGLMAMQNRRLAYFGLNLIARLPIIQHIHRPLVDFYESSHELFALKHVVLTTFLGALAYLIDAVGMTILLSGFGLAITWTLFLQTMFIFGLTAALGALSGSPNGAGVTELSSGGMYAAIITPQNPVFDTAAITAAVLLGGFFYKWFRVLVGMIVAFVFRSHLFPKTLETEIAAMEAERAHQPLTAQPESTP